MARYDSILLWILRYLRAYRGSVAVLASLSVFEVTLRVLSPWPMKAVVDHVIGSAPMPPWLAWSLSPMTAVFGFVPGPRERLLISVVITGLLVQIAHQMVMMVHSRLSVATGHRMVRDLRERLFGHLQALSLAHHARTPTGDALYRLESDACCLEHIVLRGLFPIVFSAMTLVAMFVVLAGIDLQLALVSLAVIPFLYVWLRFYTRRMLPNARRAKELESAMVQRLHESISAIRLVKTYAREDFEQRRFSDAAAHALAARLTSARQESLFGAVVSTLTIAGTSLVVLVGGLSVMHGRISLGTLLLLTAYLGFVYGPLCGIANTTGALQHAIASARRVRETFDIAPEPLDVPGSMVATRVRGHVTFEDISFSYENGAKVLDGVSFTARPGEMIALVGLSGAGKTTAVSLMTRLYEATLGRILVDGVDIRGYKLTSLRSQVAVVLQEAIVMSGTVRENLRYGRLDATDEEIEAAAKAANAHDFIVGLPRGYETELGEGGSGLSGGQRQRLSVARAFLKNAPILILDEPTAALDTVSEELVFDGLRRLQEGRTTFVIAHRLSTVRAADRILVLDQGRIAGHGTHDELLRSNHLYARLASQLAASKAA
jgi:ABC-type multidrug transport system fused ATPase/permease subunit